MALRPDADGSVAIYDHAAKQWIRRSPVDAREIVERNEGAYTFDGPGDKPKPVVVDPHEVGPREQVLGRKTAVKLREMCQDLGVKYGGQDSKSVLVAKIMAAEAAAEAKGADTAEAAADEGSGD